MEQKPLAQRFQAIEDDGDIQDQDPHTDGDGLDKVIQDHGVAGDAAGDEIRLGREGIDPRRIERAADDIIQDIQQQLFFIDLFQLFHHSRYLPFPLFSALLICNFNNLL